MDHRMTIPQGDRQGQQGDMSPVVQGHREGDRQGHPPLGGVPCPPCCPPPQGWGPWATGLAPAERLARLRGLRALCHVLAGPHGAALADALKAAESDDGALVLAATELDRLPSLPRRHILRSYLKLETGR